MPDQLQKLIAGICLALCAAVQSSDGVPRSAGPAIRVAVFRDVGVSDKVAGLVEQLKNYSELQVSTINGADIRGGVLDRFDVVLFPGGSGSKEAASLQEPGRYAVRAFVERGGGFLGICAGAYLATADYDWSLHILDAKVVDRAHWARGSGDIEVKLTDAGRQLFGTAKDRESILYWQGPLLAPGGKADIPDYESLGAYASEIAKNGAPAGVMVGTTAIARGSFGSGRVLCFSPHPERTEAVKNHVLKAIVWVANRSIPAEESTDPAKPGLEGPHSPKRFLEIAEQLKATGKYEPKNGATYCNWFARDFAKELLGKRLPELDGQANEQLTKMIASPDWEKAILVYDSGTPGKNGLQPMTAKELQERQDNGALIFYCWKHPEWSLELPREQRQKLHGHIAIGMPLKAGDRLALDEAWGTKEAPAPVPMTAQSGSRVFPYGKLSQGFGTRRKDDILIFIYKK